MSEEEIKINIDDPLLPKYCNLAVQLILMVLTVYIVARTVNHVGIVLFTWHPVLISIGVSFHLFAV